MPRTGGRHRRPPGGELSGRPGRERDEDGILDRSQVRLDGSGGICRRDAECAGIAGLIRQILEAAVGRERRPEITYTSRHIGSLFMVARFAPQLLPEVGVDVVDGSVESSDDRPLERGRIDHPSGARSNEPVGDVAIAACPDEVLLCPMLQRQAGRSGISSASGGIVSDGLNSSKYRGLSKCRRMYASGKRSWRSSVAA